MRTLNVQFLVLVLVLGVLAPTAGAQEKLAQTGMKWLSVGTDPRAVAMGEAFTSVEWNSSAALFFNPASMGWLSRFTHAEVGQTQWLADIKHMFGSVAFAPAGGEYGVLGFMAQTVDYGDIDETIRNGDPNNPYIVLGKFKPTAFMAGLGYARALNDKFSIGANVKYIRQDLGESVSRYTGGVAERSGNSTNVMAFDFGILYRTGFKSLNFGMTVHNFSREVKYQSESFQLPLTFKIGVSMNVLDLTALDPQMHGLLVSVDAEHPRDYAEQIKIGAEYSFMKMVDLRIGYVSPADEHGIVYGLGVHTDLAGVMLGVDYAYTPFGVFGSVQRLGIQFGL